MLVQTFGELFDRNLRRLAQQIDAYPTDTSLWVVDGGITNSAGNLCLHLMGNLNEYIGRQLGQIPYARHRDAEFSTRNGSKADLLSGVEETRTRLASTFAHLTDAQLSDPYPTDVLGHPTTLHYMLVHLAGHLMYHLGQIDYHRRLLANGRAIEYTAA